MPCNKGRTLKTSEATFADYEVVVDAVNKLYDAAEGDQHSMAGCLARLAGHDFMDFRVGGDGNGSRGGADGCIDFEDKDNVGLP